MLDLITVVRVYVCVHMCVHTCMCALAYHIVICTDLWINHWEKCTLTLSFFLFHRFNRRWFSDCSRIGRCRPHRRHRHHPLQRQDRPLHPLLQARVPNWVEEEEEGETVGLSCLPSRKGRGWRRHKPMIAVHLLLEVSALHMLYSMIFFFKVINRRYYWYWN